MVVAGFWNLLGLVGGVSALSWVVALVVESVSVVVFRGLGSKGVVLFEGVGTVAMVAGRDE